MDTILFFDFFHHLGNIAGVVLYFYGQGQGRHAVDRNTLVDRQDICLIKCKKSRNKEIRKLKIFLLEKMIV